MKTHYAVETIKILDDCLQALSKFPEIDPQLLMALHAMKDAGTMDNMAGIKQTIARLEPGQDGSQD